MGTLPSVVSYKWKCKLLSTTDTQNFTNMKLFLLVISLAVVYSLPTKQRFVPGEFLIRLDEDVIVSKYQQNTLIRELSLKYGMTLLQSYSIGKLNILYLRGNDDTMETLSSVKGIKTVSRNSIGHIDCEELPSPGTWGLDRIDQREALPYTDPTSEDATFISKETDGTNTVAYIFDTGVDIEHPEFEGRATWGYTAPGMEYGDQSGHGTHCAGTVGSKSYGVSKDVTIVAVKTADENGISQTSDIVGGFEWVYYNHEQRKEDLGEMPRSVVSASLGFDANDVMDAAAEEVVEVGVIVVVSGGNSNDDACLQSFARGPKVITVG